MLSSNYATFLAVAESGSFSKAAKRLFISPVAVMNQMNALESEIGADLFLRTTHGVKLTRAGQILLEKVAKIQKETLNALKEVRAAAKQDRFPIRVGSSMMRPATLLMNLCQTSEVIQRKFSLQIIPFSDNQYNDSWLKSVIGNVFDCVTSPHDIQEWYENFGVFKLGEEKFKLAVPFSHPLYKFDHLKLSDLEGYTLLTPSRRVLLVDKLCIAIEKSGFDIHIEALPGLYTANTFFEHSTDILLTRDSFSVISSGFKTLDVDWDFFAPTGIIYSSYPSPQVAEFISLLKQAIK